MLTLINASERVLYGFLRRYANFEIPADVKRLLLEYFGVMEKATLIQIQLERQLNENVKQLNYNNEKQTPSYAYKKSRHLYCLLLTMALIILITWHITCNSVSLFLSQGYGLIAIGVLYAMYCYEFIYSSTKHYLCNVYDMDSFNEWIQNNKAFAPKIYYKIECYHHAKGGRHQSTAGGVPVVTFEQTEPFALGSSWEDLSDDMECLCLNEIESEWIGIAIDRIILFGDSNTATVCNDLMKGYKESNQWRDKRIKVMIYWTMNNKKVNKSIQDKYVLLHASDAVKGSTQMIMTKWFYFIVSLLLCSLCYRIWLSSKMERKRYKIVKSITL
eukprot:595513_1